MNAQRLKAHDVAPEGMKLIRAVDAYLRQSALGLQLIDLVKMRASQINGCAYCLDTHSKAMREEGESEQRIYLLDAWRESPLYTPRERAALAWTEALTHIAETHAPDEIYEEARAHFSDKDVVDLTFLIGLINLYNRLAISLRYEHPVDAKP